MFQNNTTLGKLIRGQHMKSEEEIQEKGNLMTKVGKDGKTIITLDTIFGSTESIEQMKDIKQLELSPSRLSHGNGSSVTL